MHIIEWSDDFALGIPEIDKQHRSLVGMINALDATTHGEPGEETTRRLLEELNDYVRDHFALEERMMAGGHCSVELVTRHHGEHAYFRSILKDLRRDFDGGRANVTVTLIEYLVHWLLHHIAVVDRAMAKELSEAEVELSGGSVAALLNDVTEDLTDSERHLLTELRRANETLEREVEERTRALTEKIRKLETELREMSALVEHLSRELSATRRQK